MRIACLMIGAVLSACAFAQDYFPPGSLAATAREHEFRANWYSEYLKALQEPSVWRLSLQKPSVEVYRFLWLRTFDHPIAVRLSIVADRTGILASKETGGHGGYEPGKLIRDRTVKLSKEQVDWFCDRLEDLGFWKLPAWPKPDGTVGCDGAQWIVEGAKGGRYHVVDRWSPERGDPVHAIGTILMIDLAGFKLLYQDVY
jgi:hypothetical protein